MTHEEYFTQSIPLKEPQKIRFANPAAFGSAPPQPFMAGLVLKQSGALVAVFDGDKLIASLGPQLNLVVAEGYRGRGIATQMIAAWYRRHPDFVPTRLSRRTAASQAATRKAWEILQREGWPQRK